MPEILIKNIRELLQVRENPTLLKGTELSGIPSITNAWLIIREGKIRDFGSGPIPPGPYDIIDAGNGYVFPSFVDSHTHLVFAAFRESEFVQKIQGRSYAEIAASGGGILNSAANLRAMSEEQLLEVSLGHAKMIMACGTGSVEIKSGYGLTTADELKMLRVARKIGEITGLRVKSTFLGAHAFPGEIEREDYIKLILEEMIPLVAEGDLAEYIDVFCEKGFFSEEESIRILERGKEFGLVPKVHANQLNLSGGVQVGVKTGSISVDHLETVGDAELELLAGSGVIATLLPGAAYFLRMNYPPARRMIELGIPIAIASDFNPGSSPSGNMQTMWSLACIGMKMTPEEAFNAMTVNTAFAMQLEEHSGIIAKGRRADLVITRDVPSFDYIPYSFGEDCISRVLLAGKDVARN